MGSIYDQSSAFRAAVAGFFGSPQNAYGQYSSDYSDLSFTERLGIIDLVAGGDPQTEYNPDIPTRSAGASIAAAVLNTDSRQEAWDELSNPNFNSGLGVATWADAGVSYVANTVDAGVNVIPIVGSVKMGVETAVKVGLKSITENVAKTAPRAYSVAFQMQLDSTELGLARRAHFNIANDALQAEREANPALAELVPAPEGSGLPPAGWTWQHATIDQGGGNAGVMQLVPRSQHTPGSPFWSLLHPLPGGAGGYSEWAIPAGAPPN
jgi:hypothetical protein